MLGIKGLLRYYANDKDLELTLFSAYFIEDFCDNTDNAIKTAYSFSHFVINTYGYKNFINADLTDYRTEYIAFLGKIERYVKLSVYRGLTERYIAKSSCRIRL